MSNDRSGQKGEILLEMRDIVIDGYSDDRWHEIVKGVDITLKRGEDMGLIGESVNLINGTVAPLLLAITITDTIHLVSENRILRREGFDIHTAARRTLD